MSLILCSTYLKEDDILQDVLYIPERTEPEGEDVTHDMLYVARIAEHGARCITLLFDVSPWNIKMNNAVVKDKKSPSGIPYKEPSDFKSQPEALTLK